MNGVPLPGAAPGRRSPNDRSAEHRAKERVAALSAMQERAADGRPRRRRTRHLALALTTLALAFYFGFIAITIYRSHR